MSKAKAPKSLDWLQKHQPDLVAAFCRDHSEERVVEIVNSILKGLDEDERPKYNVKRLNGHYSTERISEKAKTGKKATKRRETEENPLTDWERVRVRLKTAAGLRQ